MTLTSVYYSCSFFFFFFLKKLFWRGPQSNELKLRDVFQRYGHRGIGGKHDITLYAREFAYMWKDCGVIVRQQQGGAGGTKEEEKVEDDGGAADDGGGEGEEEESTEESTGGTTESLLLSPPTGLPLMDVVLMFPTIKFSSASGSGAATNDSDGGASPETTTTTLEKKNIFNPDDDATNFEIEMNCKKLLFSYSQQFINSLISFHVF